MPILSHLRPRESLQIGVCVCVFQKKNILTLLQARFTVRQTVGVTNICRKRIIYQQKEIHKLREYIEIMALVLISLLLHREEVVRRSFSAEL